MRVLIIEDDPTAARMMAAMLRAEAIASEVTDNGEDGVALAELYDYDAVILDLNLPDMNGQEVLRRIRYARRTVPVIIVSGYGEVETKVRGLMAGADDYLTKPFDKSELMARLHATVRRASGLAESVFRVGSLCVYLDARIVEIDGVRVHLTAKEYAILEMLARRANRTVSKESLLEHLYGGRDEPGMKIIDVFVCKLRKKLADASGGANFIETVWGRGYHLDDAPAENRVRAVA